MIGADRYWESTFGANMQPVQCFNTFQLWEAGMSILFVLAACVTSGAPVCQVTRLYQVEGENQSVTRASQKWHGYDALHHHWPAFNRYRQIYRQLGFR